MRHWDPLYIALERLGKETGCDFKFPRRLQASGNLEIMTEICQFSRIRYRQIKLGNKWWKTDGPDMLVFYGPNRTPAAAVLKVGVWRLYRPDEHSGRTIDRELAKSIIPLAYVFYPTFPNKVGYGPLLKMTFQGSFALLAKYFMLGILGTSLALFTPFIYKILFDQIVPNSDYNSLIKVLIALAAIALTTFSMQLVGSLMMLRFEGNAQDKLNIAVWDRFFRLPVSFFREYAAGDLIQRSTMMDEIRKSLSISTVSAFVGGFFALLYIIPMLYFSWQLTLISVITLGISFLITLTFLRYRVQIQRTVLEISAQINLYLIQLVQGIAKIRVAGAEERAFTHWFEKFSHSQDLEFNLGKMSNLVAIMSSALNAISLIIIYATVIYLLQYNVDPNFTIGTFMAFNAAFIPFTQAVSGILSILMTLIIIVPSWERARLLFDTPPEVVGDTVRPKTLAGGLHVKQVYFRYPNSEWVLEDLSISANPGEFVGIVGYSGSGKSTLLRVMLGFELPEQGKVVYDQENLNNLDKEKLRQQLGVVLQTSAIIVGTVYENIVFGRNCTIEQIKNAITLSCLDEVLHELPLGLDTILPSGGGNLSGGQKQRILLARALVMEPRILILDEATSALDTQVQAKIKANLASLKVTRIVVAHRLTTLEEADMIYVIDKGRIVEQGTFADLEKRGGIFAQLAKHQKV